MATVERTHHESGTRQGLATVEPRFRFADTDASARVLVSLLDRPTADAASRGVI